MMKVRDYLELLETERDELGTAHCLSDIGAKGLGVVSLVTNTPASKVKLLPQAVQWKLLEDAMESDAYKKDIKEFGEKKGKDLTADMIEAGVEDMLTGKSFNVAITVADISYGLAIRMKQSKIEKVGRDLAEDDARLFGLGMLSADFKTLVTTLVTYKGASIVTKGLFSVIADMDYSTFLILITYFSRVSTTAYNMDWATLLKN